MTPSSNSKSNQLIPFTEAVNLCTTLQLPHQHSSLLCMQQGLPTLLQWIGMPKLP
jgi:hypothetical protein